MKKTTKYLMLAFLFLVIIAALFYVFLSQQKKQEKVLDDSILYVSTSTPKEIVDPKIMTTEERKALKIIKTLNVEVIRRNASGTPTDYRIIK